jgi:hypothetical protein
MLLRHKVSRVLRCHCAVHCSMTAFDRDNVQLIFSALMDWWLRKFSYSQNISKLCKGLVSATHDCLHCLRRPVLHLATALCVWWHESNTVCPRHTLHAMWQHLFQSALSGVLAH